MTRTKIFLRLFGLALANYAAVCVVIQPAVLPIAGLVFIFGALLFCA